METYGQIAMKLHTLNHETLSFEEPSLPLEVAFTFLPKRVSR